MPRKSPRESSKSPASGSRRSSRIASLTKEEATPPRASRSLAESPSAGKSPRTRVRTPVKTPAKASPKTPTSQKRGQKRKADETSTPTSKRGRRGESSKQEKEEEPENEVEENEKDEADTGPSGDLVADTSSNIDDTNEVEQENPEDTPVEEEPMETEVEKEDEKPQEPVPERAPIECPSIKITPPIEETKPAVAEEQPMETSQAVKPIDTSPQGTTTLPEADQTTEPKPTDSRPGTNTVSVVCAEQDVTEKEDVEPAKDPPTEQETSTVVDSSLEQTTEDKQDSDQEQVVPDQKPEEVTSATECKSDDVKSVDTGEIKTDKPTDEPVEELAKEPTPTEEPVEEPAKEPTPTEEPVEEPAKEPTPTEEPVEEPAKEPTPAPEVAPAEVPAEVEIQEDLKQTEIKEVGEEKIPEKEQVASTGEIEKLSTEGKNENDIKNVEETVAVDTSLQTKEKVEVTNGQSDTKHLPSPDATAVIESPQKVDSQSPGVISVGTN